MPLPDFPTRKQPHAFGCLPTCVQFVLASYGEHSSYEEVAEWCRELPQGGCIWFEAVTGLIGQGYTVEEITTGQETPVQALMKLRRALEADNQAVIVEIGFAVDQPGHAVVAIKFEQTDAFADQRSNVTYMDPADGQIHRMPIDIFLRKWEYRDFQAFTILGE